MISVIIPCYNSDPVLLRKCIDSILAQTYTPYEIIVVDDGSKIEKQEELDEVIKDYPEIICLKKPHGGLSKARNNGIDVARGEFVTFVDSDDFISRTMLEDLSMAAKEADAEIVLGGITVVKENEEPIFSDIKMNPVELSHDDSERIALIGFSKHKNTYGFVSCGPCAALYRTEFVKDTPFINKLEIFEDVYWNVKVFRKAKKVVYINKGMYAYRQVSGSVTHTWKLSTIQKRIISLCEIKKIVDGTDSVKWFAIRVLSNYTTIITCIMKTDELKNRKEKMQYAREISRNEIWSILCMKRIARSWDMKNKIKHILYRMNLIIPIYYLKYGR